MKGINSAPKFEAVSFCQTTRRRVLKYRHALRHRRENLQFKYRYAPLNDVSVNDGPHIRRWSHKIMIYNTILCGPGSSVGIATELRAGRSGIESRVGRDFPPVQTGPGAHPASSKMGTGSFPGVKCGRVVLLTPHPLLVPQSWKSTHPLGHTGPVTGSLYLL